MNQPYEPPQPENLSSNLQPRLGPPPTVWTWYRVYCVLMALLYLACAVGGVFLLLYADSIAAAAEEDPMALKIQGGVFSIMGVPFFLLYAFAPFLSKGKFAWIYGFVTIGIGLTSVCCMPATIPLLIFWLKDDTKRFFGV